MSDPAAPESSGSLTQIIKDLEQQLPAYAKILREQIQPTEEAKVTAAEAISPRYNELAAKLLEQYGPRLASAGAATEAAGKEAGVRSDTALLQGSGGQLLSELNRVDRATSPDYYARQKQMADQLGSLLGSINLEDADAEAERLVSQENARAGTLGTPSATSTVSNALSFGAEMDKRRSALGQALNLATGMLPQLQSKFGAESIINRAPSTSGMSSFAGVQKPGGEALSIGSELFGQSSALKQQQNDINSQRRDILDRMNEISSSMPNISI